MLSQEVDKTQTPPWELKFGSRETSLYSKKITSHTDASPELATCSEGPQAWLARVP